MALTDVQLYGYRILHNLLRTNLSRFFEVSHDLSDDGPFWTIRVKMRELPAWTGAYKPARCRKPADPWDCVLEISLDEDGVAISTTVYDRRYRDCRMEQDVGYEDLFRVLPAVLLRQAGLVYPVKDQDPLLSAL